METKDEILQLERRFWEEANNPEVFRQCFAEDGLAIMEPAGYIDKQGAMDISAKAKAFKNVRMEDVHFRQLTPDCVALAYHGEGVPEGDDKPYRGSVCAVYVRRNDKWQLAIADHQPRQTEKHSKE